MLYVHDRFLFIHIPRTAGTSITRTLAGYQLRERPAENMWLSTGYRGALDKHATLREIKAIFGSRINRVYKFAIDRPTEEIIQSDYDLQTRDIAKLDACMAASGKLPVGMEPAWSGVLQETRAQTIEQFSRARWGRWLNGRSAWDHWTGGDPTVHRFTFNELETEWPRILSDLGMPPIELARGN